MNTCRRGCRKKFRFRTLTPLQTGGSAAKAIQSTSSKISWRPAAIHLAHLYAFFNKYNFAHAEGTCTSEFYRDQVGSTCRTQPIVRGVGNSFYPISSGQLYSYISESVVSGGEQIRGKNNAKSDRCGYRLFMFLVAISTTITTNVS